MTVACISQSHFTAAIVVDPDSYYHSKDFSDNKYPTNNSIQSVISNNNISSSLAFQNAIFEIDEAEISNQVAITTYGLFSFLKKTVLSKQSSKTRSKRKYISLKEAREISIKALIDAENNRQAVRDREVAYWANLENSL